MLKFKFALLFLFFTVSIFPQSKVCSDPQSINYSSKNGLAQPESCLYNPSIYAMPVKYLLDSELNETSALLYFRDDIWTLNDGGNDALLYHLDLETGKILQRITIIDRKNNDWESLAQDDEFIYIGAFGNNHGVRSIVYVYKVRKDDIPSKGDASVKAERIRFAYEDYVLPKDENKHNFDCEAFISMGDTLYFFTKNRDGQKTNLYRIPKIPGRQTAERIGSFDVDGLITGADYNQEKNELILIGYTNNDWVPFMWIFSDFKGVDFFGGKKRRIDMPQLQAPQIEGVCFTSGGNGMITSEAHIAFAATAYTFSTDQWMTAPDWIPLMKQSDKFDFDIVDVKNNSIKIKFTELNFADYLIEIHDAEGKMVPVLKHSFSSVFRQVYLSLNTKNMDPGNYKVIVRSGKKEISENFIKK